VAGNESAFWAERKRELWDWGHRVLAKEIIWRDVGQHFGKTEAACRMKFREMQSLPDPFAAPAPPDVKPPVPPPTPPRDPLEVEQERQERRRDLLAEQRAVQAVAGERSFRAFVEGLLRDTITPFPAIDPTPAPDCSAATLESMVQLFSDWHAYELVSAERVRGFNEYNADIMGRRVRRVVDAHRSIKARMERGGGWSFGRLVLGLNGDFMSGTIHEVERHSDAPNVVMAAYGTGLVLAQAIRDLAQDYPEVECFCSSGNHGRLPDARRMQQKDPTRSWDTLVYLIAREHLRQTSHIRWYIPDSYSVAFEVEGWRFLQTHGHDVKSWNSIPFYGINRMMANLNALEASRGTPVHYALLGHFHTASSMEAASAEYFVNGSLIGGTEFSVQGLGKADTPKQMMLGVHPEHGVTHRWPLLGRVGPDDPGYDVTPWKDLSGQ